MEKKFELRKIEARDIFLITTIIKKIGLSQFKNLILEFLPKYKNEDTDKNALYLGVGVDIACLVLENLDKCEQPVYKFLSNVSGLKEEEIATLTPSDFMEMIVEVVKKDEFKDFFQVALRLAK